MKSSRNILLCVTGGIAAYKIPELVRRLVKAECDIEIIMTEAAERFVTPMTLATLTGRRVWRQRDFLSDEHGHEIPHIRLAEWASAIAVAPCSANSLSGIAHGRASSLVEAAILAAPVKTPVLLFPTMNVHMYEAPATQANLRELKNFNSASAKFHVIEPVSGNLACGVDGRGRMPEPSEIAEEIFRALHEHTLEGKKILVTAGPTREYIDPVRFISNPSTGRMGLAMARAAWYRGADVRVVLGPIGIAPVSLYNLDIININSALEMRDAVMQNLQWADVIVKAAAVGDYRAREQASHKIKREGKSEAVIDLVQNPDIAAEVGKNKRPGQILIGFAAETDDLLANARAKLERKNLDLILANDVLKAGSGFASDTNTLRMIARAHDNVTQEIFSGAKIDIAGEVWDALAHGVLN